MPAHTHKPDDTSGAQLREEYLNRTREFWQSRTSRELTQEDAREFAYNLIGFFKLLHELSRAEQEQPIRDTSRTAVSSKDTAE